MGLEINEKKRPTPKIDKGDVINLHAYRHIKSKGIYFVNGFCINESTLETYVLYTGVYEGLIWSRPRKEFEEKFELMTKKK